MSTTPSAHGTWRPGKNPPTLASISLPLVLAYLGKLDAFFHFSADEYEDYDKIVVAGLGIKDERLAAWRQAHEYHLEGLTWTEFRKALVREVVEPDFVFNTLQTIRDAKQGREDFQAWHARLQTLQRAVPGLVSDLALVREEIFNMDPKLRLRMCKKEVLRGTGLHEEEMDARGITALARPRLFSSKASRAAASKARDAFATLFDETTPDAPPSPNAAAAAALLPRFNLAAYEQVAREEWGLLVHARAQIDVRFASLKLAAARAAAPSSSRPPSLSSQAPVPTPPAPRAGFSSTAPRAGRGPRMTERQRAYLMDQHGCFRCQVVPADHSARHCPNAKAKTPVVVPPSWEPKPQKDAIAAVDDKVQPPEVEELAVAEAEASPQQSAFYGYSSSSDSK
ncbi:hypothetical protein DMC30DRAFT_448447 [Rhodotorula diobovata]|uniref:Retrotransposon gag domain-containing protein n=1 Tax=Rhodotorula diobovata TaxID=5288 RepID=A0A5C5FPY4_9BASI|nr:hypothetical protein DMC30DRAFT_448447 [Rhodotorula diobovata]